MQVRVRGERIARLSDMALSSLQSDIQSVTDLGGGRYQLAVSLLNAGGGEPIYVMSPDVHAYVQVGMVWQEVPLRPVDDGAGGAVKIDGKHVYHDAFDAQIRDFTQLLPNYMHVRFSDTMRLRTPRLLLRLPEAVRHRRRRHLETDAVPWQTTGLDPDAAPLRG